MARLIIRRGEITPVTVKETPKVENATPFTLLPIDEWFYFSAKDTPASRTLMWKITNTSCRRALQSARGDDNIYIVPPDRLTYPE